jgi:glycosyltransferase involved in cell wall biosynthesis
MGFRPVKIIFFLESLHSGGKERRSVELIRFLRSQSGKYDIELVLTEEEIHYEEIYETGVPIHILKRKGIKYDPGIFFRFYRICRNFNPDLIHTFGKMATFYAIPAKIICDVPLVSNLISDTLKGFGRFSKFHLLQKINVRFSNVILSNSKAGLKAYNVKSEKARVIYNGVMLSRFRKEFNKNMIRSEFGVKTKYLVIMVATFSAFKNYDLFVDIAVKSSTQRSDITFMAVGDGPLFERIKRKVEENGLSNIILTGRQKNVEKLVSASDIGLLCTYSEGISNSIIEYMALGKPVITTDITGGSLELLVDGSTGYCLESNADLIISRINFLLDNPEFRIQMGNAGRRRIEKKFSVQRMGEEFANLYSEILKEKRPELEAIAEKIRVL